MLCAVPLIFIPLAFSRIPTITPYLPTISHKTNKKTDVGNRTVLYGLGSSAPRRKYVRCRSFLEGFGHRVSPTRDAQYLAGLPPIFFLFVCFVVALFGLPIYARYTFDSRLFLRCGKREDAFCWRLVGVSN
ncbi:hypothetical protein SODALDRAFT_7573 [Sodiomyces alkalinus F11]|uniref:Transmembrane protein n=1 Tax=Sodiomyces alkalinus (strain CBS 110278 / VKM F-3762 / F11) TaxID=1314773 RepID=A0A3N2Q5Q5_SODAK|nr:hypothetical protein SODALDRAFT_7573 [Sodiomyces alkalinus F11]ROT42109.1 hypothetical protein SODALDRAFT_7573 [Sodiomyces alkalinus F11]